MTRWRFWVGTGVLVALVGSPAGAQETTTMTVAGIKYTLVVSDDSVDEDVVSAPTFTITREDANTSDSVTPEAATVTVVPSGSAENGVDYVIDNYSVSFSGSSLDTGGETIEVDPTSDTVYGEGDETVTLTLRVAGAEVGKDTVTIRDDNDDDPEDVLVLSVDPDELTEGADDDESTITVAFGGDHTGGTWASDLTITLAQSGTADEGDYDIEKSRLTLEEGESKVETTVTITGR